MSLSQTQIKFDVVGSFLPPEQLTQASVALRAGEISPDEYRCIEDDAIRAIIDMQLHAGLQAVTSGDLRNHHRHKDFYFGLNGIKCEYVASGHLYQPTDAFTDAVRISGRIAYNPEHPFFDDFKFLYDYVAGAAVCRQSLPSPAQLYTEILTLSNGMPERIYPDAAHLIDDIAEAYRLTIRHFYDLGCRSMILDDSVFGQLCDARVTKRLLQGGVDLLRLHEDLIILTNLALEEIPSDMDIIIYMSAGDDIVPRWNDADNPDNIIPKALAGLDVDSFLLPFAPTHHEALSVLRYVGAGKRVILGLTSATTPAADNIQDINTAIEQTAQYLSDGAAISISTSSGFRAAGAWSGLTYADQWRKLRELADIALQ